MSKIFIYIAGAISIIAGLYMAGIRAAGTNSIVESIANGMGFYFIAKGIFMIASSAHQDQIAQNTKTIDEDHTQTCSACRSRVHKLASKCSHCGSDLNDH